MRGVRTDSGCGVTDYGADGPARRSSSVSRGVMDGATANSSPQTSAGRDRMTRPSRRSSSRGAARGFWIRAWGQREPAIQGTGRSSRTAQWLGWLEGGLDVPATHAGRMRLTSTGTPAQVVDAPCSVTRLASRKCSSRFTSLAPLRRRAARGSSAHQQVPGHSAVPFGDGRPFS
jgi:hypothetical protein